MVYWKSIRYVPYSLVAIRCSRVIVTIAYIVSRILVYISYAHTHRVLPFLALPRPSDKDEAEQKIAKEIEKDGCKCEGGQNTFSQSDVDRNLADDIDFENNLQNFLYVAKKKKTVEIISSKNDSTGDNRSRSKRYIEINEHEPMESVLMRTVRSATESPPDIKIQNETDKHLNWVQERRMDPTNSYYTIFSAEVPANTTEYLFTNLRHFSLYTLSVHVCRKRMDSDDETTKLCSPFESWDKRTFMMGKCCG